MSYKFNPFTGNFDLVIDSSPGGSDTQVQFNDGGDFGGDSGLVFNKTTKALTGTGDWEILKGTPEIKLTSTGDSNNTRLVRTDNSALAQRLNTVYQPGGVGNALDFDGTDDYIRITDFNTHVNDDISTSIWVKGVQQNDAFVLCQWDIGNNQRSWSLNTVSGLDIIAFRTSANGTSAQASILIGSITVFDNTWHHIVLTYNSGNCIMYIDGVVDTGVTGTCRSSLHNSTADITMGVRLNSGVPLSHLAGLVDEVAIWSKELSANDASDLYANGLGLTIDKDNSFPTDGGSIGTNLVALWHHDETAMNQAPGGLDTEDFSGDGNHGTAEVSMTDADFVTGKVLVTGGDQEVSIWQSQDGEDSLQKGIQTYGDKDGKTILDGKTLNFNISGTNKANIDNDGTFTIDNGSDVQALILTESVGQSVTILEHQNSDGTKVNSLNVGGGALLGGDVTIGLGEAGIDYVVTFNGETNDGIITWMEDEDYFAFNDDILLTTTEKVYFRDSAIGIYSQADTFGDLFADGGWRIGDSSTGAPTNYSQFASNGTYTLVGTARVKKEEAIFAVSAIKGAGAPTETTIQIGTTATMLEAVLSFSQVVQNEVYFTYHVPEDTDDTVNIEFHIMWKPGAGWTAGNYVWKAEYIVKDEDVDSTTVASTIISMDVTPSNATDFIETEFSSTIDANAEQTVSIHFYRDVANDNGDNVGLIRFFEFERTCNKLGETV